MAYTASAVTFLLPNIPVPVVFTGSQLPPPEAAGEITLSESPLLLGEGGTAKP